MKFSNLFKKELKELITRQTIFAMLFTMILLILMGQVFGQAMSSADTAASKAYVINEDKTEFTETVLKNVGEDMELTIAEPNTSVYDALLTRDSVIVIPSGFSETILRDKKPGEIKLYGNVIVGGISATMGGIAGGDAVNYIFTEARESVLLTEYGLTEADIESLNSVTATVDYAVFGGKTAEVSAAALSGILTVQMLIAPIVIMILLLMASQMIMVAISTEKIDKTLETLLSTPVSRLNVLLAKMAAALLTALLNAVFTAVGMVFYISGFAGSAITDTQGMGEAIDGDVMNSAMSVVDGLNTLGLTLTPLDYFLFFVQLFLSIAIGLAISLMLGATATDTKSLSNLIMPMMIAIMIPFVISFMSDISTLPLPFAIIMWLIPFTHSYTAIPNLIAGDFLMFFIGMAYQLLFLFVTMFAAIKMFTSDKLFTMAYSAGKRKSLFDINKNA
jgi:ABC-2 type transport system permease protein